MNRSDIISFVEHLNSLQPGETFLGVIDDIKHKHPKIRITRPKPELWCIDAKDNVMNLRIHEHVGLFTSYSVEYAFYGSDYTTLTYDLIFMLSKGGFEDEIKEILKMRYFHVKPEVVATICHLKGITLQDYPNDLYIQEFVDRIRNESRF